MVEVKTLILDTNIKKFLFINIHGNYDFNFLAIVIFNENFEFDVARLIPVDVVSLFVSPEFHERRRNILNLRVTDLLLNYPGTINIQL